MSSKMDIFFSSSSILSSSPCATYLTIFFITSSFSRIPLTLFKISFDSFTFFSQIFLSAYFMTAGTATMISRIGNLGYLNRQLFLHFKQYILEQVWACKSKHNCLVLGQKSTYLQNLSALHTFLQLYHPTSEWLISELVKNLQHNFNPFIPFINYFFITLINK